MRSGRANRAFDSYLIPHLQLHRHLQLQQSLGSRVPRTAIQVRPKERTFLSFEYCMGFKTTFVSYTRAANSIDC